VVNETQTAFGGCGLYWRSLNSHRTLGPRCGNMLKLSVRTKLDPLEALDRANRYFGENGLALVETIAHLHGKGGFAEIRVSGGKLVGKREYDSKFVLDELAKNARERFGLESVSFGLHFHAPLGHVDVSVSNERPAEVNLDSVEYDIQVRQFAERLPKA